jgi:hypothetical protein
MAVRPRAQERCRASRRPRSQPVAHVFAAGSSSRWRWPRLTSLAACSAALVRPSKVAVQTGWYLQVGRGAM